MHDTEPVNGIILSSMPVGEADRRLSLLTKELGKISCFARGARRPTSRLVGDTHPFAFGVFELTPGRDAYSLSQVEISEHFETVQSDLTKSAYGACFLELSARMSHENTDGGPQLSLLYYALRAQSRGIVPPALVKTVFDAKTLQGEGMFPEFGHCVKCGKAVETAVFKPALMQIVCESCADGEAVYPQSKSALYALNFIYRTEPAKLFTFSVTASVQKEMTDVVDVLLHYALEKPLKSAELLEVLIS